MLLLKSRFGISCSICVMYRRKFYNLFGCKMSMVILVLKLVLLEIILYVRLSKFNSVLIWSEKNFIK